MVLLGDIALGPMPGPTLDRLAELGDRAVWVHGNCEREMVTAFDGGVVPGPNGADAAASAALIGPAHRDRLDGLPLTVTLDVDGLGPVLFCHASPRRDDEMVLVDSPPERWAAGAGRRDGADRGLRPHPHAVRPAGRRAAGASTRAASACPTGTPGRGGLCSGRRSSLRRTLYDTAAAARVIAASGYAGAQEWAREYVLHHYSDTEALEAFTQIAREQAAG